MSKMKQNYVLRVKNGSDVDRLLTALNGDNAPLTQEELEDVFGTGRARWVTNRLGEWFDNIAVDAPWGEDAYSAKYTDIMPNQIQVVSEKVEMSGDGGSSASQEFSITWPEAPPIPEGLENFDEPDWYGTFKTMVQAGKHVSFEGPPSVGKDTAVIQAASELAKPLVTIGGDGGFRKRDLTGGFADVGLYMAGEYVTAAINGWWVLLTEVNAADPDALMYINSQLAPPHVVTINGRAYPVHPDFRIFVSYNHGLIGTKPLPQSFKDRFLSFKVPFFQSEYQLTRRLEAMGMPDHDTTETWTEERESSAFGPTVEEKFMRESWQVTIVRFGMEMWDAYERGQMRYQITTRRLIDASNLMERIDGMDVKTALEIAALNAIDSPVERKAAENVLKKVIDDSVVKLDGGQ